MLLLVYAIVEAPDRGWGAGPLGDAPMAVEA
jgi:hypothetical protein